MPQTIFSMINEARKNFGSRPFAYQKNDVTWVGKTFDETFDECRLFASFLLSRGYKKGDRVAIYAEGSPNWIIGEYGTIFAGCIAVPLSFKLLPEELAYRLEHSEARIILTNTNHIEKVARVANEVSSRTRIAIELVSLDEDLDFTTTNIDYPIEQLIRMDKVRDFGKTALEQTQDELNQIEADCEEDDVVTISYTSGTTGNPKGIMLTHGNYWINSRDSVDIFRIPMGGYRDFVILPVDHSFAQTVGIHASVQRGIEVWFVDSRGGGMAILRNIPDNMKEAEPVFMMTVPALSGNFMKKINAEIDRRGGIVKNLFTLGISSGIKYLGDETKPPRTMESFLNGLIYRPLKKIVLDKVRIESFGKRATFFSGGGASFDIGQQRFFRALGMPLYQGYGMTEASPVIATNTEWGLKLGTSGVALPNVEIRIAKEDGTIAGPDEKGEIQVRGPNLMKGYFKNPDATVETIVDGWLKTGDLGWMDADGYLTVAGRAKALLISADGEKYSPEGIEEAILTSAALINQVLVWNDHRKFTCALVTLDDGAVQKMVKEHKIKTSESLLEAIKDSFYAFRHDHAYRNTVPPNWTPATFQVIEEPFSEKNGLINSTMKIVRYKVIELYADLIGYIYSSQGSSYKNEKNIDAIRRFIK